MILDLFGDDVPTPTAGSTARPRVGPQGGKHYVKPWGYFAPPGTGPKGETCQTCRHCVACGHSSHRYLKCLRAQGKWTHGRKTDILARSPACSGWEAMEAAR